MEECPVMSSIVSNADENEKTSRQPLISKCYLYKSWSCKQRMWDTNNDYAESDVICKNSDHIEKSLQEKYFDKDDR